MTTVLCTLYNSLYLDKGLVLYDSLCECAKDFKLYVLCMDDKCYEVLTDLKQEHHIPVRLSDFEAGDEDLLTAKANRPMGEYCWTCSSSFIRYVLKVLNEPICTYIDCDMYFYNDPQVLIDGMLVAGQSVMLTPHRFPKEKVELAQKVGNYCVEFNTFKNSAEGLEVLEYWRNRCLECCSNIGDGIHWGDQKYLEELVDKFDCVYICQESGAGVAPWNITLYKQPIPCTTGNIFYCPTSSNIKLVFYHFQSVKYITSQIINTNIETIRDVDLSLVDSLYFPYLKKIGGMKDFLSSKYGIWTLIKCHPTEKRIPLWKKIIRKIYLYNTFLFLKVKLLKIHPYIINISENEECNGYSVSNNSHHRFM